MNQEQKNIWLVMYSGNSDLWLEGSREEVQNQVDAMNSAARKEDGVWRLEAGPFTKSEAYQSKDKMNGMD